MSLVFSVNTELLPHVIVPKQMLAFHEQNRMPPSHGREVKGIAVMWSTQLTSLRTSSIHEDGKNQLVIPRLVVLLCDLEP